MSRFFRFLLLFLLTLPWGIQVRAQRNISGVVVDSASRFPLAGVHARLVSPADTADAATNAEGKFTIRGFRDTTATLELKYLGYRNTDRHLRLRTGSNTLDTLTMTENPTDLEAVVVRAERPMMSIKGDTLVFHPENVRVMPGDEIMQVVRRLPGMDIANGKIRFRGKTIERTYVDGRPLFGEEARPALDYLAANEVIDIQVYEEEPDEEKISGERSSKKRTVLNLITRTKPTKSTNLEALAGYGTDIDRNTEGKHTARYSVGASYRFFSEEKSYLAEAGSNNNNLNANRIQDLAAASYRGGEGDRRNTHARASFSRKFKEKLTLYGDYNFSNSYYRNRTVSEQLYFPSADYDSRTYRDTSQNTAHSDNHSLNLSMSYNNRNDYLYVSAASRLGRTRNEGYQRALNELDGQTVNRVASDRTSRGLDYGLSGNLSWSHAFAKNTRRGFSFSTGVSVGSTENDERRIDTLASEQSRSFLEIATDGKNRSASGNVHYTEPLGADNSLSVGYELSYTYSKSLRMAIDRTTQRIDTALTYDYTRNYTTHSYDLGFLRSTKTYMLLFRLEYENARLNKDEHFPRIYDDRYRFRSLLPSATFRYYANPSSSISLTYDMSTTLPSVEQLRNELDNTNKLSLSGGNPNLRQSLSHALNLYYYKTDTESARTFGLSLYGRITARSIATRQLFFTEDTPLPDYNGYIAAKGATLLLPVNVNGAATANLNGHFSTPLKKMGMTFNTSLGFSYTRTPSYLGEKPERTDALAPSLHLRLSSTKSAVWQFEFSSGTYYNHSANSLNDDSDMLTQQIGASATVNFLKRCYAGAYYNYDLHHNFDYPDNDVTTHTLNLILGIKLTKERRFEIALFACDLLNNRESFSSYMVSDYISNRWSRTFGRFISLTAGYRFNKTGQLRKSGRP